MLIRYLQILCIFNKRFFILEFRYSEELKAISNGTKKEMCNTLNQTEKVDQN